MNYLFNYSGTGSSSSAFHYVQWGDVLDLQMSAMAPSALKGGVRHLSHAGKFRANQVQKRFPNAINKNIFNFYLSFSTPGASPCRR